MNQTVHHTDPAVVLRSEARHPPMPKRLPLLLAAGLLALAGQAQATTIVGGSDLLNAASAQQLTDWLGQGSLQLTNIFDKAVGLTSTDFHAAADGKGATFTLIEVTGYFGVPFATPVLIGGYNPQSWSTINNYNYTADNADRTAFVFNLNESLLFRQRLDAAYDRGYYQTYNNSYYGPTFGGGHDIYVDSDLNAGYSYLWSYAAQDSDVGRDVARYPESYNGYGLNIGQLEVFSITPDVAAVPEPSTNALMLAGLGVVGHLAARRRRAG